MTYQGVLLGSFLADGAFLSNKFIPERTVAAPVKVLNRIKAGTVALSGADLWVGSDRQSKSRFTGTKICCPLCLVQGLKAAQCFCTSRH